MEMLSYAQLRIDTRTWRTFIQYSQMSDGFRSDLSLETFNIF